MARSVFRIYQVTLLQAQVQPQAHLPHQLLICLMILVSLINLNLFALIPLLILTQSLPYISRLPYLQLSFRLLEVVFPMINLTLLHVEPLILLLFLSQSLL